MKNITVTTSDNVELDCNVCGQGNPLLFVHEFGGDQRSWHNQISYFSRRYQCITFNARGYPPSSVPASVEFYSQNRAVEDMIQILDHLEIEAAHLVGHSMGGFAVLHLLLQYPKRALSGTIIGVGYGAEKKHEDYFRSVSNNVAHQFIKLGSDNYSHIYGAAASRIPFQVKDPIGWHEFRLRLSQHSEIGASNTMLGVQALRPSLYDLEAELSNIDTPLFIVVGDEDDHCLQTSLFLKSTVSTSGLLIMPKTGHTVPLEEPGLFNLNLSEYLSSTELDRWLKRDPRTNSTEIMKIS
jgi:pimeloyl-ACP methyl ester carboxylesterase